MRNILSVRIVRKAASLLIHPFTLSLIVTLVILRIFPFNIPKYQVKILESRRNAEPVVNVWEDLENDEISDGVFFGHDAIGYAVVNIYFYPSGRVKEWDIPGKLVNQYNNNCFLIGKTFDSNSKEIFVFTKNHDSLFLNRITDLSGHEPAWKQIFICTFRLVNGTSDVRIISPRLEDLDEDTTRELIFGISSGFSIAPRALFIYDFNKDTLSRSMETGNYLRDFLISDINGDRKKEIITMGYAPRNILEPTAGYHDSSNWVMVFDHSLNLVFPPVEFPGRTGTTEAIVNPVVSLSRNLFILWYTPSKNRQGLQLYQIPATGGKRFVKEFGEFDMSQSVREVFFTKIHKETKFLIPLSTGELFFFDTTFRSYEITSLDQPVSNIQKFDVDLDGQPEMLVYDHVSNVLTVFREDFSHPASVNAECADPQKTTVSLKRVRYKPPLISLCAGNLKYMLSYQKNPLWHARWIFRAAVWLAVFLFTLLIRKIQRIQLEKQFRTEKKITELQLKIVRNQMDPHFTMNAINAVVDAINKEEKEQARDNLLHFSQMYRSLVLSADKIKRTLREEIEFTENYLALERFRFGNRFSYKIEVCPGVDLNWEVPKMVIQSPVENAVKHGLAKKDVRCETKDERRGMLDAGGEILIQARKEDRNLILEIADNGIGRAASGAADKTSTGKGMEIMEQFFELYHKITGIRVQSTVTDLTDKAGQPSGTMVLVTIPLAYSTKSEG